ncbi:chorismate mutase [Corynebacterium pacaense]|uniref:chorismate mutase n=1 Tax=Corynebacterium pacaense TaxID=1816684 RepID=UPI0009B986F4|nr:chorismate mutase [Corynebacterium pacaense]
MDSEKLPTLNEVRSAIDGIDQRLVQLIAGTLKKDEDGVRAPALVEAVIDTVRSLAGSAGASPDATEDTHRAMIGAFIELELAHHRSNQ